MQTEFLKTEAKSKPAIENALVKEVVTHRATIDRDVKGGSYLPLSVYEKQGYNTTNIEKNCASIDDPELKEKTYKLNVISVWGRR